MVVFMDLPEGAEWVLLKKENILVIDSKYRPENCSNLAVN